MTRIDKPHWVAGRWVAGSGEVFESIDPATGAASWSGRAAGGAEVDAAVTAAASAQPAWARAGHDARLSVCSRFAALAAERGADLAAAVTADTGKPRWEAAAEARLIPAKLDATLEAVAARRHTEPIDLPGARGVTRYRPLGIAAVLGPFNMPAHLPNGHILPALLAGNAVVFKPSEHAPQTGALLAELWRDAGLPPGVLNLVQGAADTGSALADHGRIDAVMFTGSPAVGRALSRRLAGRPEVLLALELGGNNPLVVHGPADPHAAAYLAAVSAYITAGQRCTCARRLIVTDTPGTGAFIDRLTALTARLVTGLPADDPEPFVGPLICVAAAERILDAQRTLIDGGARPLVRMLPSDRCDALVSPGLLDVTDLPDPEDTEHFGPLLQLIRVPSLDAAINEANRTAFGLAAALLGGTADDFADFRSRVRAGVVNWNRPTTGASGRLPFGGLGASGNHRPSGAAAIDYCADPVACLEADAPTLPDAPLPGVRL